MDTSYKRAYEGIREDMERINKAVKAINRFESTALIDLEKEDLDKRGLMMSADYVTAKDRGEQFDTIRIGLYDSEKDFRELFSVYMADFGNESILFGLATVYGYAKNVMLV